MTFYTARYDAGFKNAIGCESQKDLLKYFLEKTLDLSIEELVLDPKELEKPNIKIKTKTLDVLVKTKTETINLEINNGYYNFLPIRNFAYISSVFSNSVFKGDDYLDTKMHIQLNITWGLGIEKDIKSCYMMCDKENDKCYCDKLKIIEINMDKIMNMWYHGDKKKALEYKYFLMLDLEPKDLEKVCKGDKMMEKYKEKIEKLNEDPEFIEVVSKEKDAEMVYNSLITEGYEQGIEDGISQGLEQGISSRNIEIAKNLLDNNVSIDVIIKSTGLSKEEVEELSKK